MYKILAQLKSLFYALMGTGLNREADDQIQTYQKGQALSRETAVFE